MASRHPAELGVLGTASPTTMTCAGEGAGQLAAILESESSEEEDEEEEKEEEEEEDEEAAMVQQHPSPGQEVGEAEERLAELEQASQALLAELSALETEFEIERTCRQQAEAYAAQVKQENKHLKRLSLALTAPPALPKEEPPEEDPDPAQRYRQQLEDLQEKISWLLAQRKDLTIQVQELQRQNQDLQDQLEKVQGDRQQLRAALGTSQRALKSFKRPPPESPLSSAVSQIVTQDYCEAMQQLQLEQDLRVQAEAFAHEMLVQKKEANRQSTILLQSAGPSAQLLAAMQEVGRLTRALEEARQEQQQRLEEQLGRRPEPEELDAARAALAAAEDEKLQLKQRLQEAEARLGGLEEEVGSLREKLAQDPPPQSQTPETPAPAPPPPPPPLPPPSPTVPVDPLSAIRQRKGLANARCSKPETDDAKARAVQEMMERIKNGVVLRPAKERVPLGQALAAAGSEQRSAALELQSILGAMRRASRRPRGKKSSLKGRDKQLGSILQRRRQVVDAPLPTPGPPQQDREGAGAAGTPDPGDKDVGTAPSGCSPGSGDRVPFRPRAAGGLPRTRPLARLAAEKPG
ncbi:shootin-1-like [Pelecanus crispus]|uniref:shootin-1-like n=1 Tax=Pelecanus crispus TaxID=36300 RepID=UPI003F5D0C3D